MEEVLVQHDLKVIWTVHPQNVLWSWTLYLTQGTNKLHEKEQLMHLKFANLT